MAIYSDELLCDCHDVVVSSKIIQVLGIENSQLARQSVESALCQSLITCQLALM